MNAGATNFVTWLRSGNVSANLAQLVGGTALAQAIIVSTSPVLTRLYTPAEFGSFTVFTATLSILLVVASLRLELAIPLEPTNGGATALLALSVILALVSGIAVAIGVIVFGAQFVQWTNTPALLPSLWLLPVILVCAGTYQALGQFGARIGYFGPLSFSKALQSTGQAGTQVLLGLFHFGALGLVLGYVVGNVLAVVALIARLTWALDGTYAREWIPLTRKYRRFPIYSTWSGLIDVAGLMLPAVLLTVYFSPEVTGHFSLTAAVLFTPTVLLAYPITQVVYPLAAENRANARLSRRMVETTVYSLFAVAVPVFAFVGLNGPALFASVFGPNWAASGEYAVLLAPSLMFLFVTTPLSSFALVKDRQPMLLVFSTAMAVVRLSSIVVGGLQGSATTAIALYSGAGVGIYATYLGWVLWISDCDLSQMSRGLGWASAASCLMILGLASLRNGFPEWLYLSVNILSFAALACFLWRYLRRTPRSIPES
jgi:O-antigen/teichoic acid export membrane protein